MKIAILTTVILSSALVSCTGRKDTASPDLTGRWYIENIVFSDSDYVRPAEAVPGVGQYIIFTGNTYSVITNCNSMSGTFTLHGNDLTLGDGAMTEMACDNMQTEDALRRIIPRIATVDMENDSIMRLNTSRPSQYILLRKAPVNTPSD